MTLPRPPRMSAPRRDRVNIHASPRAPVSIRRQAEEVVLQTAKELVGRFGDMPDFKELRESVKILRQLEGE